MKKLLKPLAWLLGLALVALAGLVAFAHWNTSRALATRYVVHDAPLQFDRSAAAVARGQHLFTVLACVDCHGQGATGKLAIDAGPVGQVIAPNLTPGGLAGRYDADGIAAAIRHGVRADGTPLRVMPSEDFTHLSDADTAALVVYLQSLPPSDHNPGSSHLTPLGDVLFLFGKLNLVPAAHIDHTPRTRAAPVAAPTAEYGGYLAQGCTGCHGAAFAGQHVPGTPPSFPDSANLTPAGDLGRWQYADFERALRHGQRPDGRQLDTFMPWQAMSNFSDTEVQALWAYLRTLPPVASAKKK